jgi:hypothetical protein
MKARPEFVNIDTVELDRLARACEAFLRSLRMLRAAVASMSETLSIWIIVLVFTVLFYYIRPPLNSKWIAISPWLALAIFGILVVFVFACVLYFYFYLLRSVAAGSLRVTWFLVVSISLWLLLIGLFFAGHIFAFIHITPSVSPSYWLLRLFLSVLILYELAALYAMYVLLAGLVVLIRSRHSPFHRLLHDQKYDRKFWPGWAALLRSFWLVMGIPIPPRLIRMPKRVTFAAICAFFWEGGSLTWYFDQANHFEDAYLKYQQGQIAESAIFLGVIAQLAAPPLIWVGFALSRWLRRYARRRSLLSADAAMLADPRKPVLFLRSFADDQISLSKAKMPWLLRFFDPGAVAGSLEELLVWEYADIGPVIAIGRPSDDLPPLGAARQYCRGTEWQEVVGSLMQASALIVVGVGRSAGLAWEIATIRSENLLDKTVFVFSPDFAKDRSMLRDLFTQLGLSGDMPQFGSNRAVLSASFLVAERPLLFLSSRITEIEYQVAIRATRQPDITWGARNPDIEAHSPAMLAIGASAG